MMLGREAWKQCRCTAILHKNDQKTGNVFFTGAFCQMVRLILTLASRSTALLQASVALASNIGSSANLMHTCCRACYLSSMAMKQVDATGVSEGADFLSQTPSLPGHKLLILDGCEEQLVAPWQSR